MTLLTLVHQLAAIGGAGGGIQPAPHGLGQTAPTTPTGAATTGAVAINLALSLIVWLPALGALIAALIPARTETEMGRIKTVAFTFAVAPLAVVLWIYHNYTAGAGGVLYEETHTLLGTLGTTYHLGLDGLNAAFLLLTALVMVVVILASWGMRVRVREYFVLLLLADTALSGLFSSFDLSLFSFFWVMELVPTFLLLSLWGGRDAGRAARRQLTTGLVGALTLVLAVAIMFFKSGTGSFELSRLTGVGGAHYPLTLQVLLGILTLVTFGSRLPLFPLHRWLSDALSDAPSPVAVLIAGAVVATGTYGLLRVTLAGFPDGIRILQGWLVVIAVVTVIYGAVSAFRQDDLRRLVSHWVVAQGGLIMLGIAGLSISGLAGAVFATVARGLGAGAFIILIAVVQNRLRTRSLAALGGLATRLPGVFSLWLLATFALIGLPASAGFVGNTLTFVGAFPVHHRAVAVVLAALVLLAAALLVALHRVFVQVPGDELPRLADVTSLEKWTAGLLLGASLWIGILPSGPLVAENHVLEPGLHNVIVDGVRPVANRYSPSAASALP